MEWVNTMIKNNSFLQDLADKLCGTLPDHLAAIKKDAAKNFRVILQNVLNQLDLVPREEFDAQTKVLARTRKKVDELEARLNDML
jgi:hypothetical protein